MVFVDRVVTGAYRPGSDAKNETPVVEEPAINEPVADEEPAEEQSEKPKRRGRRRAD